MQRPLLLPVVLLLAQISWAQAPTSNPTTKPATSPDSSATWHLFTSGNSHIDLKFIDPDKGTFGIDYRVELNRASHYTTNAATSDDKKSLYTSANFGLDSKGFIVVGGPTQTTNQVNSIINEVHIDESIFFAKPIAATQRRSRDSATVGDIESLAAIVGPTTAFFGNLHVKHETSQSFTNYDFAFGPTLSVRSYIISHILDIPFSVLRIRGGNNPRQFALAVALDYVASLKNTQNAALRNKSSAARFNVRAEWETGVFASDRFVLYNDFYYEVNAPDKIDAAGLAKKNFFMARFDHFLDEKRRKTVSVKYTKGALPPNFTEGYVLGAGFSVDF